MTAINDHQFLVIERNGTETPRFKKIYLIDLNAGYAAGNQYFIVPAPSSLALLGLGGLIAGRRRRA